MRAARVPKRAGLGTIVEKRRTRELFGEVLYQLERVRCSKASCVKCAGGGYAHGPYWYSYRYENGKRLKKYVGKVLKMKAGT